jgi:glucan phosphoethanolaminetransferase (alkaline phosphatase superfamily)
MSPEKFRDYLDKRFLDQLNWYDAKAARCKKQYTLLQWGLIVLAAVTPVLIAVDQNAYLSKWLPLITGSLVAVLSAAMKTFSFQENWINYRSTAEALKREYHLYQAGAGAYRNASGSERLFVERAERMFASEHTNWLSNVVEQEVNSATPSGSVES